MNTLPPYRGVVEIRIHGVSGTSPEGLLDRSPVRQVAGDAIGGFYRPVIAERMRDRPNGTSPDRGPWLEAYSWGGWTSGARSRALWLGLLPFALVNVAPRMLPLRLPASAAPPAPRDTPDREIGVGPAHRFIGGLIRLLALSLTVTYTTGFADVALVAVGRRCGQASGSPADGTAVCQGLPGWLVQFLHHLSGPGQLAITALIPIAAVGVLWGLSTKASQRYEDVDPEDDVLTDIRPDDDRMPLGRRDLWRGSRRVRRLRLVHIHAGFASIAAIVAFVLPPSGMRTLTLVLSMITLGYAGVMAAWRPSNSTDAAAILRFARFNWITLTITGVSVAVALTFTHVSPVDLAPDEMTVDLDHLDMALFVVQAGILSMVLIALLVMKLAPTDRGASASTSKPPRTRLLGLGTFVFAFLGWLVGLMFMAALQVLAPTWLFSRGFIFGPSVIAQFIGEHRSWFGSSTLSTGYGMLAAVTLIAILILLFAGWAMVRLITGGARQDRDAVMANYFGGSPGAPGTVAGRHLSVLDAPDAARPKSIAFMFWIGRRVDYAPVGLGVLCVGMITFLLVQFVGYLGSGFLVVKDRGADGTAVIGTAVAWGAYFTVAALVGAIVLGVASYRVRSTRKGVGVLWDLTCFWPRDVHPFAPPCYTERIVPEVSRRIKAYFSAGPDGRPDDPEDTPGSENDEPTPSDDPAIVVAAHSQGTVISMAVLLAQPPDFKKGRVALLTFGTVLDRLYARFFPRYFSEEAFARLAGVLTAQEGLRWINLWRNSDYLGGSVPYPPSQAIGGMPDEEQRAGAPENVRVNDPVFATPADGIIYPPAGRHSNYWRDPEFQHQIGTLITRFATYPAESVPERAPEPAFPEAPPTIR